jgi:hypothetical protein
MNCRCENPRHANHAGGPCRAVATEIDNYLQTSHDKAADEAIAAINLPVNLSRDSRNKSSAESRTPKSAIEVRRDEDSWEHSLLIHGSVVENAEVHENALDKGSLFLSSDFDEVTDKVLPHSLSDFLEVRITDIHVPFGVSWNEAIGALGIKYETVEYESENSETELAEEKSSLEIEFGGLARWVGRPYAFDEYARTLHNFVELSKLAGVENRETESYHEPPAVVFSLEKTLPLIVEVERCLNTLREIHDEVLFQLGADINSLEVAFDFPG